MANYYNPTMPGYPVAKTPQQMQQELTAILQNQYMPAYNALQQQQNIQSPIMNQPCTSGVYDKVTNIQDVENYPTPTNGTAVLLFNYDTGVFYSKKFVNGQNTIQPFKFIPLNTSQEDTSVIKEIDKPTSEPVVNVVREENSILEKLVARVDAIDKKVNALRIKSVTRKDLIEKEKVDEL